MYQPGELEGGRKRRATDSIWSVDILIIILSYCYAGYKSLLFEKIKTMECAFLIVGNHKPCRSKLTKGSEYCKLHSYLTKKSKGVPCVSIGRGKI